MATPMQYTLVRDLLTFPEQEAWARQTLDVQSGLFVMMEHVRDGTAPLVDCSDVVSVISSVYHATDADIASLDDDEREESERKLFLFGRALPIVEREHALPFIRPFADTRIIPLAWPCAIMTAQVTPELAALWMVKPADVPPGYGFSPEFVWSKGTETGIYRFGKSPHAFIPTLTMVTLALAAAKNAQWVERGVPRHQRKRTPALAGIRFRHIEIDMGKPKSKRNGVESSGDAQAAWHHRRGHWAFYGPDKPLFGRKGSDGWFWRPYTEVGDKAHGEIVQDYSVKANLPEQAA